MLWFKNIVIADNTYLGWREEARTMLRNDNTESCLQFTVYI